MLKAVWWECFFLLFFSCSGRATHAILIRDAHDSPLKSSNSDKCRHYRSDQHESQVRGKKKKGKKRKKDSWDASVAGFSAQDNSDKARRWRRSVGGWLDVKDIHPVNRALSLKLKQPSERALSSLLALWWASLTQCDAPRTQRHTRPWERQ